MRASFISILVILPLALAAPIHNHAKAGRDLGGFLSSLADGAAKLVNPNTTAGGLVGNIAQTFENPALTGARIDVVKGLATTSAALSKVSTQASSTGNAGVQTLIKQAQSGLASAKGGVGAIGTALVTGTKPSKADQKTVAQGIHDAEVAIQGMNAAITTPDQTLSSNIASAATSVGSLKDAGQADLAASNLSLADLGLPADFAN